MFQLGRELRRLFRPDTAFAAPRDGLTGGDLGVLELLTLDMVRAEAKAADVAAGRISAKDRPMLQLRQAAMWRELARRTGEATALRKAADAAEAAWRALDRKTRPEAFTAARVEQARCALLGADLFGDEGLAAAAAHVLAEAQDAAPRSAAGARAQLLRGRITAQAALARGDIGEAERATQITPQSLSLLTGDARARGGRRAGAMARLMRAELLLACGVKGMDERILAEALAETGRASNGLDANYEPLSWSRIAIARGEILTASGELTGDPILLTRAVEGLTAVFDHVLRDHSPLDWARAQFRLGQALAALGQATEQAHAFAQARNAFDRALVVLQRTPTLTLRADAAKARARLIAVEAQATGDLMALDEAEAAYRCELAVCDAAAEPVAWAVLQMNLGEVYITRMTLGRRDPRDRARAGIALDAAVEVFGEHGLRSLADAAVSSLERLRTTA